MKKHLLSLLLFAVPMMVSAQLKIQSNGYAAFHYDGTAISPLSINNAGESTYFAAYRGTQNGLYSVTYGGCDAYNWGYGLSVLNMPNSSTASFYIGVKGLTSPNNNQMFSGRGYGVFGQASNFSSGYNYGVFGRVTGSRNGAGIYGTTGIYDNGSQLDDQYAGFFHGKTYVLGDLTVTGNLNGTVLQDAAPANTNNSSLSSTLDKGGQGIAKRIASLSAISYYRPVSEKKLNSFSSEWGDTLVEECPLGVIESQLAAKMHYALDVEKLESNFPELVYVKEDGTKAINYMEMIPLLVETINDLQTEVATLRNSSISARNGARALGGLTDVDITNASLTSLAQNSPNPFKEQTVIRFRLADDARDAAICIFDMTGKLLKRLPVMQGETSVTVNGWELGEGMFLYTLMVDGREIDTKRMIVTK